MRLLLVEDDPTIAHELDYRWSLRGWTVMVSHSLATAEQALAKGPAVHAFDVVVLDLGLPDGDGLSFLGRYRQRDRVTPVIVLTARGRVADRILGLNTGADDYLVKPFDPDELDARIAALQRRGQAGRGGSLRYGRITWVGEESTAYVDGQRLELLPREFEVLGLLMERAPRLLTKKALTSALAERNLEVGDSAADVYVSRLRRKLAHSGTLIRTLRGLGYLLELTEKEQR